jgi:hypothetical protein
MVIGYTAQNGKSTMAKMFANSLPIYSKKLDKKTFNVNYANSHKQFAELKKLIRFAYIEELDRNKVDIDRLKDFIDGDKIGGNEVLYGTTEDIIIHCKLLCTGNKDMNFDTDEGMKRRGIVANLTNKFIDKYDYDKLNDKRGNYIKDTKLMNNFETNNEYKMAFIHLLLPYAKKYYAGEFSVPKSLTEKFKELCDDNDCMKTFITETFDITGNDTDRIYKDDFLMMYNAHYNTKHNWPFLLSDVKRLLTYDRHKRAGGNKGVIVGIKIKTFDQRTEF